MKKMSFVLCLLLSISSLSISALAGWRKDSEDRTWWYHNPDGSYPKNKWEFLGNQWYYFDNDGYMVSNKWIGNYYLGSNGAMLRNTTTPDGYKVGADGAWLVSGEYACTLNSIGDPEWIESRGADSGIKYLNIDSNSFNIAGYFSLKDEDPGNYNEATYQEFNLKFNSNTSFERIEGDPIKMSFEEFIYYKNISLRAALMLHLYIKDGVLVRAQLSP